MSNPVVRRSPRHQADVVAAEQLTPRMRRVTVRAESMVGRHDPPGSGRRVVPARGHRPTRQAPLHDPARPAGLRRTGPRRAVHGHGPGSAWGASAAAGDAVEFQGPRGKLELTPPTGTCSPGTSRRCLRSPPSARLCLRTSGRSPSSRWATRPTNCRFHLRPRCTGYIAARHCPARPSRCRRRSTHWRHPTARDTLS